MSKAPVLFLKFPNKWSLYLSYMPWLKKGGFFIPTKDKYKIGDSVLLLLSLPEDHENHAVSGKVSWISIEATPGKKLGVGVHLDDSPKTKEIKNKMETMVAGWIKSDKSTYIL